MANPFSSFTPGFTGLLGTGAGRKSPSSRENLNYAVFNTIENAIMQLYGLVSSAGHYGAFVFETMISGYYTETFDGDGSTTEFYLSRSIAREWISGWDINLENPYQYGILPSGYGGQPYNYDSSTKLTSGIQFSTAPPVGTGNVIVIYKYPQTWGSVLSGSAYLSDYPVTG